MEVVASRWVVIASDPFHFNTSTHIRPDSLLAWLHKLARLIACSLCVLASLVDGMLGALCVCLYRCKVLSVSSLVLLPKTCSYTSCSYQTNVRCSLCCCSLACFTQHPSLLHSTIANCECDAPLPLLPMGSSSFGSSIQWTSAIFVALNRFMPHRATNVSQYNIERSPPSIAVGFQPTLVCEYKFIISLCRSSISSLSSPWRPKREETQWKLQFQRRDGGEDERTTARATIQTEVCEVDCSILLPGQEPSC